MSLYLNEIAPWERKDEYHQVVQLGSDVKRQTEAIRNASKQMVSAQLASANAIIVSQEHARELISNELSEINCSINDVAQGIDGLKSEFQFGISEVVWQIEQNRQILQDILQILSAPLDTQAKELKRRAEEAYANGWIDEALDDFLDSENKNRYDFSIHISLGMIYIFHKIDKQKALEYFDKAIKYARPKSNYHTSFALLHKALINRDIGNLKESEQCAAEAAHLSPDFAEAYYQNAAYKALLGEEIDILKKAIKLDKKYILKAYNDDCFINARTKIDKIASDLRDEQFNLYKNHNTHYSSKINEVKELISKAELCCLNNSLSQTINSTISDIMNKFDELNGRNAFLDYLHFNTKTINDISKIYNHVCNEIKIFINSFVEVQLQKIRKLNEENSEIAKLHKHQALSRKIFIGGVPVSILAGVATSSFLVGIFGVCALILSVVIVHNGFFDDDKTVNATILSLENSLKAAKNLLAHKAFQ